MGRDAHRLDRIVLKILLREYVFSFLIKLSARDKAGIILFGLQIRNNVKIYADGLSSKRGEHKVFFHVTLADKNSFKKTLLFLPVLLYSLKIFNELIS